MINLVYEEELGMKKTIWIILEIVIEMILIGGFVFYMLTKQYTGAICIALIFIFEVLTDILKEVKRHNKYHSKIEEKIRRI